MVLFSVNATVPLTAKRPHRHHNSSLTVFEWDRNTTERRSGPFKTTRLMVKLHQACTYVLASEGLPDKAFSEQKCTKCRLAAGLRPDPLEGLQRSPNPIAVLRALLDKAFSYKMQQMSLGGRAPPGPAGELTAFPQTPSCIETSRAFGARSLASRLRRSETERSGSFFPVRTLITHQHSSW